METKNVYRLPIDLDKIISVQTDSLAHINDLIHSIDYDAPDLHFMVYPKGQKYKTLKIRFENEQE